MCGFQRVLFLVLSGSVLSFCIDGKASWEWRSMQAVE